MESEDGFAITLSLFPRRERPELCARLAPLKPPASGARDVPARSGSECNRRLGEGSSTSRLSEPLRPGTGRAPKEGSWAGNSSRRFLRYLSAPAAVSASRLFETRAVRNHEGVRRPQSPANVSPSPGAADAVSAKDKNLLGRGE